MDGHAFAVTTWQGALQTVTRHLVATDPARVQRLLHNSRFVSPQGRHLTADRPDTLDVSIPITDGLFLEGKLAANYIARVIGRVLAVCGIPATDCRIRLQGDPPPAPPG